MPDDDVLAEAGITVFGLPHEAAAVADTIRWVERVHRRSGKDRVRRPRKPKPPEPAPAQRARNSEPLMGTQHHKLHSNPRHAWAEQGKTRVVVSRNGEELEGGLMITGGPAAAVARAHEHYAFRASMGALDPGIYRFRACGEELSLRVEDQNAVSSARGVVKNGRGGVAGYPTTGEHRSGRSSILGDGLRPRMAFGGKTR